MTLFGVSADIQAANIKQIEQVIGCQIPVVRQYRAIDRITSYTNLSGRQVIGSAKPKIGQNLVPMSVLLTGKYLDYFRQNAADLVSLPLPQYGKNIIVNWHEFDVGALDGTPDQINQFILDMNKEARNISNGKCEIATCIGSWNMGEYQQFKPAILDADILLIDQPYNLSSAANPASAMSILAPRLAALRTIGVKRFGIAEWGSIASIARPQWIRDAVGYIQAQPDIEVACYFDSGSNAIIGKADEWALDMAVYEGRMEAAEHAIDTSIVLPQGHYSVL